MLHEWGAGTKKRRENNGNGPHPPLIGTMAAPP
jgi:hypothetical protein